MGVRYGKGFWEGRVRMDHAATTELISDDARVLGDVSYSVPLVATTEYDHTGDG